MYLSRITLCDPEALRQRPPDAYALHQAVWGLFADDPDRRRDFLFRREEDAPGLLFLVVSRRPPQDDTGRWRIEAKEYAPKLAKGDRLHFRLRANPVRTGKNANDKQARFDVVMDAKTALRRQGVPREKWPSQAALAYEAGSRWLSARGERLGFTPDPARLRVEGYRQLAFDKGRDGGRQRVSIATLDFEGLLTVTDPERLTRTLFEGVGPGKSFGCGLLLVRRG
jgi:CRISPR system Cascade subunit CasE